MIQVTRLNGTPYYINAEMILTVESTPDTILTLIGGAKMVVHESAAEVIERIIEYKRKIYIGMPVNSVKQPGNGD